MTRVQTTSTTTRENIYSEQADITRQNIEKVTTEKLNPDGSVSERTTIERASTEQDKSRKDETKQETLYVIRDSVYTNTIYRTLNRNIREKSVQIDKDSSIAGNIGRDGLVIGGIVLLIIGLFWIYRKTGVK